MWKTRDVEGQIRIWRKYMPMLVNEHVKEYASDQSRILVPDLSKMIRREIKKKNE